MFSCFLPLRGNKSTVTLSAELHACVPTERRAPSQDEDDESEGEETSSEGVALEAAAALAAVAALVEGLKAFLSPHLSALLHLLFSPAVLACKQANCSETASSIRIQLAAVMPARLLLGPLFGHFDGAVQVSCTPGLAQQLCMDSGPAQQLHTFMYVHT